MLLVERTREGFLQLRADWLPQVLHEKGVVDELARALIQHLNSHPVDNLLEAHRWVLGWLDARFEGSGVFDYLDGCKFVDEKEIAWPSP